MPLVQITAPAGVLPEAVFGTVQKRVADLVLEWMGLPQTEFFAGATWVYLRETENNGAATGVPGTAPGFLVEVTPLEDFLTPERNEALAAGITAVLQAAAGADAPDGLQVWTVVREIPEGYWAVGGALTQRSRIDELVSQASAR